MKFKQLYVSLFVTTVFSINFSVTKALAQQKPVIQFGQAIGSPGCLSDVEEPKDNKNKGRTLMLLFENFQAKDGERKACNIRINTAIPKGFRVRKIQFLYQVSTEVPSGTRPTTLARSYIFNGGALGLTKLPAKVSKFTSTEELYQEQDEVTAVSASCGGQGQLGVNMLAQSYSGNSIVIDTPVEIYFQLAPC